MTGICGRRRVDVAVASSLMWLAITLHYTILTMRFGLLGELWVQVSIILMPWTTLFLGMTLVTSLWVRFVRDGMTDHIARQMKLMKLYEAEWRGQGLSVNELDLSSEGYLSGYSAALERHFGVERDRNLNA